MRTDSGRLLMESTAKVTLMRENHPNRPIYYANGKDQEDLVNQ
jgi:hypothetical protein